MKPKHTAAAYIELDGRRYALVPATRQRHGIPGACEECALRRACNSMLGPRQHSYPPPYCLPFVPHDERGQLASFWRWKRVPSQTRILRSLLYAIQHGRTPRNLSARIQRAVEGRTK